MRTTRSNTIASLLAAVGAGFAAAAIVGAPAAVADDNTIACEPGQIVIDGNCAAAPVDAASRLIRMPASIPTPAAIRMPAATHFRASIRIRASIWVAAVSTRVAVVSTSARRGGTTS